RFDRPNLPGGSGLRAPTTNPISDGRPAGACPRMSPKLDAIDWRILKELQADGSLTNVALAARVGITPPPCLRRVKALEDAGYITGYHAALEEVRLGFAVTAYVMVGLYSQSEADLRAFENRALAWSLVRSCDYLAGETDFLLRCVAPDLQAF